MTTSQVEVCFIVHISLLYRMAAIGRLHKMCSLHWKAGQPVLQPSPRPCRSPGSDHISPILYPLHWLPVEQRIEYKLLFLAFRSVNNEGPSYLSDLKLYIPSRLLRSSSDSRLLRIPSFRLKSFGRRKFSYIRPLSYGTFSRTYSVIPTLHLPSNLL